MHNLIKATAITASLAATLLITDKGYTDSRGQAICGVPASEAIAITMQGRNSGKWWAAGPIQTLQLLDQDSEIEALNSVSPSLRKNRGKISVHTNHQMPTFVCNVSYRGRENRYRLWRLHFTMRSYDSDVRRDIP